MMENNECKWRNIDTMSTSHPHINFPRRNNFTTLTTENVYQETLKSGAELQDNAVTFLTNHMIATHAIIIAEAIFVGIGSIFSLVVLDSDNEYYLRISTNQLKPRSIPQKLLFFHCLLGRQSCTQTGGLSIFWRRRCLQNYHGYIHSCKNLQ
ncbi:hypothetical protein L3Y34_011218 [Caenorhabditis briggsae]|uniref:Uncharacterized protein n=1 Tax=Caenorhabditis briggsae TaxID=6238 RepID=A0AAE9CUR4_CAEBR|nr:hypothetical protein L3Y34_011218 [Caenorhabditis briggsae]